MPTQTFFRLPEEKRKRLIDAAWKEFSGVRFAKASINRIVQDARIPRGSFYQYFENKEDLFFYLLGTHRDEAIGLMHSAIADTQGDPFRASLLLFDQVFPSNGQIRPSMQRVIEVLRLNRNMDMSQLVMRRMQADRGVREIEKHIDWSLFLRTDKAYLCELTNLLIFSFAAAVHNILCDNASFASERAKLSIRLEVLRQGSLKEEMIS